MTTSWVPHVRRFSRQPALSEVEGWDSRVLCAKVGPQDRAFASIPRLSMSIRSGKAAISLPYSNGQSKLPAINVHIYTHISSVRTSAYCTYIRVTTKRSTWNIGRLSACRNFLACVHGLALLHERLHPGEDSRPSLRVIERCLWSGGKSLVTDFNH